MAAPTMLQPLIPTATQQSHICCGAHVSETPGTLRLTFQMGKESEEDNVFITSSQGNVGPTEEHIVQP